MQYKIIAIIISSLLIWSCTNREEIIKSLETEVETQSIQFKYDKFGNALKEAEKQEKPLLIYFTSDGCGLCLKMEKEVFTDSTLQDFINKEFICSKVHLKRTSSVMKTRDYKKLNKSKLEFMDLYKIEPAFPTFAILDFRGHLISKKSKYMNIQEFIQFGKEGLK